MIIKEKDTIEPNLAELERLASLPNIAKSVRSQIEKEQKILKAGHHGEKQSAYFINFYYSESKNWAIIHDLRVEYSGFVAQIDHLLINRFLDIYVLETKHYSRGIKITERGEFLTSFNKHYSAIESPIEQNKRHI